MHRVELDRKRLVGLVNCLARTGLAHAPWVEAAVAGVKENGLVVVAGRRRVLDTGTGFEVSGVNGAARGVRPEAGIRRLGSDANDDRDVSDMSAATVTASSGADGRRLRWGLSSASGATVPPEAGEVQRRPTGGGPATR
jgi:hypothetical protein